MRAPEPTTPAICTLASDFGRFAGHRFSPTRRAGVPNKTTATWLAAREVGSGPRSHGRRRGERPNELVAPSGLTGGPAAPGHARPSGTSSTKLAESRRNTRVSGWPSGSRIHAPRLRPEPMTCWAERRRTALRPPSLENRTPCDGCLSLICVPLPPRRHLRDPEHQRGELQLAGRSCRQPTRLRITRAVPGAGDSAFTRGTGMARPARRGAGHWGSSSLTPVTIAVTTHPRPIADGGGTSGRPLFETRNPRRWPSFPYRTRP